MNLLDYANLLAFDHDEKLEAASAEDLRQFITTSLNLLEVENREFLLYGVRDLRTRVIQHFVPAKILRNIDDDTSRLIRHDIRDMIENVLGPESDLMGKRAVEEVIHRYGRNMNESRRTTPSVQELLPSFPRCAICGYKFGGGNPSERAEAYDCLKPLSGKEKLRQAEVEHWVCVGRFGTNELDNLRLCCKQCNQGKYDYLCYSETRHSSGYRANDFIRQDNRKMEYPLIYAVLQRDRGCRRCNRNWQEAELTIAPKRVDRLFVYDNLISTCYDCDKYVERWLPRKS